MKNIITQGTELLSIPYNREKSIIDFPINEDKGIVVLVTLILENEIIEGIKIWDEGATTLYAQKIGVGEIEVDSFVVFYRVGDFNSQGINGFELHNEDASKCSFVCFAGLSKIIFVQIVMVFAGIAHGNEVQFCKDGNIEIIGEMLECISSDPLSQFHNQEPPWEENRIFFSEKIGEKYICWLPGYGEKKKELTGETENGDELKIDIDGQGNILNFILEVIDDFYVQWLDSKWMTITYSENWNLIEGYIRRIFLINSGESLGNDIEKKEILLYKDNYDNYIGKITKSKWFYGNAQDEPLFWSHKAYRDSGKMPEDYYQNAFGSSDFFSYSHHPPAGWALPGCGIYPPTGQIYSPIDRFCVRCKEYNVDGTTRITQKNEIENMNYATPRTFAYVAPWGLFLEVIDANWFCIYTKRSLNRSFCGVIPQGTYIGYGYDFANNLTGIPTIGTYYEKNNSDGGVKFTRSLVTWGSPLAPREIIIVQQYLNHELWYKYIVIPGGTIV